MPVIEPEQRGIGPLGRHVITASHHITYLLSKRFRKAIPLTFVVGYPRSGTVWVTQMVADILELPFADLSFFPIGFPSVIHGHQIIEMRGPSAVYVVRDGRDALTSMYFYLSRTIPNGDIAKAPKRIRRYFRDVKDINDVSAALPGFIEQQCKRPLGTRHNWADHVNSALNTRRNDVPVIRFEDLKADAHAALTTALEQLTGKPADPQRIQAAIDRFDFARQAGRNAGTEDAKSFTRKGGIGDWKNHFNDEAKAVFDHYCGETLVALGYEKDRNWCKA